MIMNGYEIRLQRMFDTGNAVVVAVDHGMFDGPYAGIEDIPKTLEGLGDTADGILLSPGALRQAGQFFGHRGAPLAIVRLNYNSVFAFGWNYRSAVCAEGCLPAEALAAGADVVLICLTLKTGSEQIDARNVEIFARLAAQAHALGLPVIGEYFPTNHSEKILQAPDEFHEEIMVGCRMLQEFGADAIKTFHTNAFDELTAKINIPILGLGAEKTPTDLDALQLAAREISQGGRGVVFGRNVFQASSPGRFLQALKDVVKHHVAAEDAAAKYELTRANVVTKPAGVN